MTLIYIKFRGEDLKQQHAFFFSTYFQDVFRGGRVAQPYFDNLT